MKAVPDNRIRRVIGTLLAFGLVALMGADRVQAQQQRDEYGDVSAQDVGYQTVARISYLSGNVSFARGDDPDNWQAADQNVPMSVGDRIYTDARSRVELESDGGDVIRVGARSELSALNLTGDTKQFAVKSGIVSFHVGNIDQNDVFEVDTPNSAITFEQGGDYRVEVDDSGNTRVVVQRGNVLLAAGGGQINAHRGQEIRVDGIDSPQYDVISTAARGDSWDQWVDGRVARAARSTSYQYVNADVVGAADLDDAGRWEDIPQYGHVWTPTAVAVDWAPYRVGHWVWQDPWGWTWISAEPWGWAPYHYGRWVTYSSRWYWVPVAPSVRYVTYAPACVAFVGGGPGFSASVTIGGGGFVGWFPLAPSDPFNPWWGPRAASVNVTNVTYVNKTYVTVVNQNTFVSGGAVTTTNIVRDRTVVSQVAAAPVVRGALPVVPTVGALRVATRTNLPAPPKPPAAIVSRPVVARVAPPPAPPTFQAKMAVIKENHGAPVAPAAAATLSVKERGRAQAVTTIKPVASGQVTLAPRTGSAAASAVKVESVKETRGRPLATSQAPVASSPVTVSTGRGREAHAGPPAGQTNTTVDRGRQNENAGQPQGQGNTTTVDRGRPQTNLAAPTPARPVVTEEKKTTTDQGRQPQDFRGRPQPTAAPQVAVPEHGREPQNQDFRGRPQPTAAPQVAVPQNQNQGQHRQRPTPVPTARPQSNTQNQQMNTQQSGRGRERSVEQSEHGRPTPIPPPPQGRERSSAGPPPSPKPQPQSNERGRQQQPPEKEKTKKPDEH